MKYSRGSGFQKDPQLAYEWHKKAHEAGHVRGTAALGSCLVNGSGVTQCFPLSMVYLTQAATSGSALAALYTAGAFAMGLYGIPKNEKEAIFWLRKSLGNCAYPNTVDHNEAKAQALLDDLLKSHDDAAEEGSASSSSEESVEDSDS
ncbi:Sel1 domain protein repeat-containing protein [Seminavis robusta]|uniref:Sel1 domain protein repeat-containing protein n=1 Tax=Seminavis robusta TaxID=568900 RepID=A0A9N8HY14_9STRA|nr:Sel1 domain protein repeat-containing protein [Seminavis robusta]|eukprot:Sro3525_g348930.1 Sel1 domain protein repeat-containing protein (147) ;mRNA; r:4205-4645